MKKQLGEHFTFERVPFDWVTNFIGATRNHFNRVPLFAMFAISTVALGYEIFE